MTSSSTTTGASAAPGSSRDARHRRLDPANQPPSRPAPHTLNVDDILTDPQTHILVCCGSGGGGKTTTAASLALRAAEAGRKVCVLTIDPAKRLAQSMGLAELDNTPRSVSGINHAAGGSLDAMMLDMKRTFDEVVQAHATPEKAEQILSNPFYQALSSSFAGTQEYMAMEKLGQLHHQKDPDGTPRWDLVVVDTPPSRSALDFLDAPARLGSFLDGRFIRLLMAPAKAGGRAYFKVLSAGVNLAVGAMSKILGSQMLQDVQTLTAALDTMFGGFRERADQTYALLSRSGTAFLVVASPERDALREAGFFIDRLGAEKMPLAGLVVNRVMYSRAPQLPETVAVSGAVAMPHDEEHRTTIAILRLHAAKSQVARRHQDLIQRFLDAHPGVASVQVPAASQDIHDLEALREIGAALSGTAR